MAKERVGQIEEIPCVRCGLTRHTIRGSFQAYWEDKDSDISGGATYDLMECNGCQWGKIHYERPLGFLKSQVRIQ